MNLLPKNYEQFSQKEYWDSFFRKRGKKAFEWYGEYPELCEYVHKYIKTMDNILIVGCGNSALGNDMYDIGYNNITNIDISHVVIKQMMVKNKNARPDMKFMEMDALKMSFSDQTFSVILDKGTLDALMSDAKENTKKNIEKYFQEILRTLKVGGRYICISLLQAHILDALVEFFPTNNCFLRVVRCHEAELAATKAGESSMPIFIIVCTKFITLASPILEIDMCKSDKMLRLENSNQLKQHIQSIQDAAFICTGLKRTKLDEDVSFDLFDKNDGFAKYTIHIVDIMKNKSYAKYAALIVPQGREAEWLFSSKEGRRQLAASSKCNRLAVVTLHRGQTYTDLDSVKSDLNDIVLNFAPNDLNVARETIHFLSLGSDVGRRIIRYEGESKSSGKYIIEDVTYDENTFRRLYYLNNQSVIQSEAKLKTVSEKGTPTFVIDINHLICSHHIYMCIATSIAVISNFDPSVLVIGLGGGGLCSFLRNYLPQARITAVDIDADMLTVAREWFGLIEDDNMNVVINDGIEFLRACHESDVKYDAILFDVDSKDNTLGMSCPPKDFVQLDVINTVLKILNDKGMFILNLVIRNTTLKPAIETNLKNIFNYAASYKLEDDLNEIYMCCSDLLDKDSYRIAAVDINKFYRKNTTSEDDLCDTKEYVNNIKYLL